MILPPPSSTPRRSCPTGLITQNDTLWSVPACASVAACRRRSPALPPSAPGRAQLVSPIVIVIGAVANGAEQLSVVPPPEPTHDHAHGLVPDTAVAEPELHKPVAGAEFDATPLAGPQTPLTGGTGVQSTGALGVGAGAVIGAKVGTTSVPCPGTGPAWGSAGSVQFSGL